jgi:hypothetical protein
MASSKHVIISLVVLAIAASAPLGANPISQTQAESAVAGWLNSDETPMGARLGDQIAWTDAYNDANGLCVFYIVYLDPSGFVIVAADDLVEPVVGFVTGYSYFDPSPANVLGAMVGRDLPSRVGTARKVERKLHGSHREYVTQKEAVTLIRSLSARVKWRKLSESDVPLPVTYSSGVSDVRVSPLLSTTWGQDYVGSGYCYNYYTPNHYYDGCVATAMAQFMRYWQWPAAGIGAQTYGIYVNDSYQYAATRGGDGSGGPYDWRQMVLKPNSSITTAQRQAIGALCYDAGVAANMQYSGGGSGAYMHDASSALVTTFMYSNSIMGGNEYSNIGSNLTNMINPNLDSGNPVLLGIWASSSGAGHAIVADGYGYNSSTLYHHLNLGWDGAADAWYNLPTVDTGYYTFDIVMACIYNIYASGNGEIISGRLMHASGVPFPGATVTAEGTGGPYTAVSNSNGIYALVKVRSNTTYTITVAAPDCSFEGQMVTTGFSANRQTSTGNRGGIDFVTSSDLPLTPAASAFITYPDSSFTGQYTVSWTPATRATAYELVRSLDGGSSWLPVYAGMDTSYSEDIGNGSYRYCVRTLNGGGVSDWTAGTGDCVVAAEAPAPPASLSYPASDYTGKYTVSWLASGGATSYVLRRSSDSGSTWTQVYSGENTSYSENVATGNYRYSVRAVCDGGASEWRTGTGDCVVNAVLPAVPESLTYPAADSTGRYSVTWSAAERAASYMLRRSKDNGITWTRIYSGADTSCSESVTTGNYRYSVKAINSLGNSTWATGSTDCQVRIPPSVPATISCPASSSSGRYTVRWSSSKGATLYTLRRSQDGGSTWTNVYSGASTYFSENIGTGNYSYCVRAASNGGPSNWTAATGSCAIWTTVPLTPASITYPTGSSTGSFAVSWSAADGARSYMLRRSKNGGATWTLIYSGANTSYAQNIGTGNYLYSVKAVNAKGSSLYRFGTAPCVVQKL